MQAYDKDNGIRKAKTTREKRRVKPSVDATAALKNENKRKIHVFFKMFATYVNPAIYLIFVGLYAVAVYLTYF